MTRAIAVKELKVLWTSPLPYVLGAAFHLTLGLLGTSQIAGRGQAAFQPLVPIAGFLLVVVAPLVSARAIAEEARSGSLDLLLAVPVPSSRIVAGKYAAVVVTLYAVLAPAAAFAVLLAVWGDPDPGVVAAGIAGLALLAAMLAGVGVLTSSLTSSQPVAAIAGLLGVLVLWFAHTASDVAPTGGLQAALSISERLRTFAGGTVDLADVAFFAAVAFAAIALAAAALDARRTR